MSKVLRKGEKGYIPELLNIVSQSKQFQLVRTGNIVSIKPAATNLSEDEESDFFKTGIAFDNLKNL